MIRRLSLVVLTLLLLVSASACQKAETSSSYEEPVVMFVSGGVIDDASFNASIANSLKKNATELKYDLKIFQSDSEEAYRENIRVAISAKPDLIIGVGNFAEDLLTAADTNATIDFAIIDGSLSDEKASNIPANCFVANFDNAEGAFLMGVLAAKANTTTGVGFIAGMEKPAIQNASVGYRAGVKAVSSEMPVFVTNIDTFSNKERGAQAAADQNQQGAGVIFGFAGGANAGVIENAAQSGYWAIGVDQDQAVTYPQYASSILCSMVKNVSTAASDIVKMKMDKSFKSGIKTYSISEGGVTIGTAGGNMTPELQALYDQWKKAIVDGNVKVPKTESELTTFIVPDVNE